MAMSDARPVADADSGEIRAALSVPGGAAIQGAGALYPGQYTWLVFLSALDVMMTWIVLHAGGREVNPIAQFVIERGDIWGVVLFKFAIAVLAILACEQVGRRAPDWGLNLSRAAVAISAFPVAVACVQLLLAGPIT